MLLGHSPEAWGAIGTWVYAALTLLTLIVALWLGWRQLSEARLSREAELRPHLTVQREILRNQFDLLPPPFNRMSTGPSLDFKIRNIGPGPAIEVELKTSTIEGHFLSRNSRDGIASDSDWPFSQHFWQVATFDGPLPFGQSVQIELTYSDVFGNQFQSGGRWGFPDENGNAIDVWDSWGTTKTTLRRVPLRRSLRRRFRLLRRALRRRWGRVKGRLTKRRPRSGSGLLG